MLISTPFPYYGSYINGTKWGQTLIIDLIRLYFRLISDLTMATLTGYVVQNVHRSKSISST